MRRRWASTPLRRDTARHQAEQWPDPRCGMRDCNRGGPMNELTAALIEALGGRVAEPVAVPDPPPPPPQIDRRLEAKLAYTIPEAGELLGLCRASVYKLIASGELSTVNLSERAPRILRQELEEFLQRKANAARDRRAMVAATLRPRSLRSQ